MCIVPVLWAYIEVAAYAISIGTQFGSFLTPITPEFSSNNGALP